MEETKDPFNIDRKVFHKIKLDHSKIEKRLKKSSCPSIKDNIKGGNQYCYNPFQRLQLQMAVMHEAQGFVNSKGAKKYEFRTC